MARRDLLLAKAITHAICQESDLNLSRLARILNFFRVVTIVLCRYCPELFDHLRSEIWHISHADYRQSFSPPEAGPLRAVGDLGYSGSSFFSTADSRFLVKSIPRWSESQFFSQEMLGPYNRYMLDHPGSLLVRIFDFLYAPHRSLGSLLRITPSHHIIMENILFGRDDDPSDSWETYDLKPTSFFYPERDLAGGHLASDSVKERLLDTFDDKLRLSATDQESLMDQLATDTKLLEECNVVDYSLFLVRYPASGPHQVRDVPPMPGRPSPWRSGLRSTDGKWVYRAAILDFFWAKHKIHAQTMTGLIVAFNLFTGKGHMSLTTSADDYRRRFLKMAQDLFH